MEGIEPAPLQKIPRLERLRAVLAHLEFDGAARVMLTIYPDGHIDPVIVKGTGTPELDQALLDDLREWRWQPKMVGGEAVVSQKFRTFPMPR